MNCLKFDLFSSSFFFNIGSQQVKKGTILGIFLTLVVLVTSATYLIYILCLYATNQLDPTFRSQSFISDQTIEMNLSEDLVGFRFEYDSNHSIESLQEKNNLTYIVYIAQFYQSNGNDKQTLLLDIIDCKNPSLQGFKCIDFSKVQNKTLSLNTQDSLFTQLNIFSYGCLDLDIYKTTIPDNCANQTQIDSIINGINAVLRLKLYTSQFNTTTQDVQVNYRNAYVYTIANQLIFSRIKAQKQISSVKTGLIIQQQTSLSSPIEYNQQDQSLDRKYTTESVGISCFSQVMIYPDELIQQVKIQFPTLPQVFAQVNSVFTLLMILGIIGKSVSKSSIKKDFIMLFLKNLYQQNYLQMIGIQQSTSKEQQKDKLQYNQPSLQLQLQTQQSEQTKLQKEDTEEIAKQDEEINEIEVMSGKQSQSNSPYDKIFSKQNENFYKLCLINQTKQQDENMNDCIKKLKAINDKETTSKAQKILFSMRCCKKRKKSEQSKQLNQKQKKKILNHINEDLDIFNFCNDMIFLKKFALLVLRKDQLAALKLVGFSRNILDIDFKDIDAKLEQKSLNYYEMQYAILQSEKLQQQQLQKFLQRCKNNDKITQIDNRILKSLRANQII